ncbi:DUF5988 family protein [Umezawaea sp. NPDC059074]|uniref:DUF5988 family protein n=1 Tax=Umezawaea sp. NPDC059074 TaxID=3346716 RepID=UPI0036946BFE
MEEITVILVGGPTHLGAADRIRRVADLAEKIKVPHGNGYEHFAATGERLPGDTGDMPVFGWCDQTKIAE